MRAYNQETDLSKELLMTKLILEIWSPDKTDKRLPKDLYDKYSLFRRAKGDVVHDQALNNEIVY